MFCSGPNPDFVNSRSAEEIEQAVTRIEQQLKRAHSDIKRVFIEHKTGRPIERSN